MFTVPGRDLIKYVFSGLLITTLSACGSGGSDSNKSSIDTPPPTNIGGEEPTGELTNSFTGSLFFRDPLYEGNTPSAFSRYDFASQTIQPLIPGGGKFTSVSMDGTRYLNVEPSGRVLTGYDQALNKIFTQDFGSFDAKSIPRYSHDKNFIAAIVTDITPNLAIFTPEGTLLNGVGQKSIGTEQGKLLSAADWSPEGQLIFAYGSNIYRLHDIYNDSFELIAANVAEKETDAIMNLVVSPSGQQVAYISGSFYSGSGNVFVMNVSNGSRNQLTTGPGQIHRIAWSPDGKHLAMAFGSEAGRDQCGSLWVVQSDSRKPADIEHGSENGDTAATKVKNKTGGTPKDICVHDGLDWR